MTDYKRYAGIGNRKIPKWAHDSIVQRARLLQFDGYILRSGGAAGADSLFEYGTTLQGGAKEIFKKELFPPKWCVDLVRKHHKYGKTMKDPITIQLMARNCQIILGKYGDAPVDFVLAWCEDEEVGGTAFGLTLARAYKIPVENMRKVYESV